MQVKEALEGRFPGIEVTGGAYPVAPAKVTMTLTPNAQPGVLLLLLPDLSVVSCQMVQLCL